MMARSMSKTLDQDPGAAVRTHLLDYSLRTGQALSFNESLPGSIISRLGAPRRLYRVTQKRPAYRAFSQDDQFST